MVYIYFIYSFILIFFFLTFYMNVFFFVGSVALLGDKMIINHFI